MSQPHVALLIGTSPDLPALFTSDSGDFEWLLEHTYSLEAGLNILRRRSFDLVVAEHHQASGAGNILVASIRAAQPTVRVIVIDSVPTPEDVIESMQHNAYSYFSRPFDVDSVRNMMRTAVLEPGFDDGIRVLSANPDFLTLRMRCNLPTADRLQHFFEELKSDLEPNDRGSMAMAFREVLINAIEHGGKLNPAEWVRVSRVRSKRALVYHIDDPGSGFKRDELEHAAISNPEGDPIEHLKVRAELGMRMGGFGLLIAQKLVDEVIYNDKGNEVLLVKHLD
jgi:anti-sigma regulatory factor (Ser/Thr protein kinase)